MSAVPSFAGFNPKPSPWGYNWTTEQQPPLNELPTQASKPIPQQQQTSSPEPQMLANQYANMPAALLNTMKREKKPFTYTPGGVNLSEVLNARLQKRIERKKKFSEERTHHQRQEEDEMPKFESPKQLIVMPTYNTPLDMYSMENALEILEAQSELVANDKSLSSSSRSATLPRNHTFKFEDYDMDPAGRGVTQSKAFKVLQIITDTDEEPASASRDHHREEVRFTGLRDSKAIPSKFFQTLQKITGTEDDEEQQQQQHVQMQQQQQRQMQQQYGQMQQQTPVSQPQRSPLQQQQQNNAILVNSNAATLQSTNFPTTALKRPAAFLPIKTNASFGAGFRPVSFMSNGSAGKRAGNTHASGGTDF